MGTVPQKPPKPFVQEGMSQPEPEQQIYKTPLGALKTMPVMQEEEETWYHRAALQVPREKVFVGPVTKSTKDHGWGIARPKS